MNMVVVMMITTLIIDGDVRNDDYIEDSDDAPP